MVDYPLFAHFSVEEGYKIITNETSLYSINVLRRNNETIILKFFSHHIDRVNFQAYN